jgi:hypothetical protein
MSVIARPAEYVVASRRNLCAEHASVDGGKIAPEQVAGDGSVLCDECLMQGAVAENEQLRSALDVMTVDRDSWKALAGELVEQRDDARRAAGGQ